MIISGEAQRTKVLFEAIRGWQRMPGEVYLGESRGVSVVRWLRHDERIKLTKQTGQGRPSFLQYLEKERVEIEHSAEELRKKGLFGKVNVPEASKMRFVHQTIAPGQVAISELFLIIGEDPVMASYLANGTFLDYSPPHTRDIPYSPVDALHFAAFASLLEKPPKIG